MGFINYGIQTLSYDYKNPATSSSFNEINYKLIPPGIYEGGSLFKLTNTTVQVSALTCYILDTLNNLGVRISTENLVNVAVNSLNPYLVLRFVWQDVDINYMDFLAIPYNQIKTDDLILGRCVFNGSILQDIFDYSLRTDASLKLLDLNKNSFLVTPSEPISNVIHVSSGTTIIKGVYISYIGSSLVVTQNTILGRNDVVYIDDTGTLQILYGIDSVTPITPTYPLNTLIIAEIKRGASRNTINGSEIFQIKPNREQNIIKYNIDQDLGINKDVVPSEYAINLSFTEVNIQLLVLGEARESYYSYNINGTVNSVSYKDKYSVIFATKNYIYNLDGTINYFDITYQGHIYRKTYNYSTYIDSAIVTMIS